MPFNMMNDPNPLITCSRQWLDFCGHAAAQSRRNMEEARRMRARLLQDVSFWLESYMRSPFFLELMRCNVAMAAGWSGRRAAGDPSALGAVHREEP